MSIIDHISIGTSDFKRAVAFYDAVLAALGYERVAFYEEYFAAGYGEKGGPASFWVGSPQSGEPASAGSGAHYCFKAPSQDAVNTFYDTAIKMGATCNGKPGPRPHYSDAYYGGFVIDHDGNKLEAVCFA